MCGIAGIWGEATPERLHAMADRLAHRGPDDEGTWTRPEVGVGLTYRRLAVIDLEGGQQPVFNEDGRIVAVCNGEIYNYRELREELIARGHRLTSQGDTEVVVHLYEDLGCDLAIRLRGMFAIAIWDEAKRQLVLIRDRVGKKPLYYSESGEEFLFASELKGLLAGARSAYSLDEQSVADYLTYGVVLSPATIYQEARAVEPGERVVVHRRRVVSRTRYWQPRMGPKVNVSRNQAVAQVDQLLHDAIRLRLRADVPVGCFLSGGIDSGIVTAIAARHHPGPLTTITVGFEDAAFDERPLARRVARRYGTNHHEEVIRPDVADDLPRIVRAYDQPFGDASALPSFYIARAARRHVKVVLNGDGGDEILAGYRRHVAAWIAQRMRWLDRRHARSFWRMLSQAAPMPGGFRTSYAFLHRLIRGLGLDPPARYRAWSVDGFDEPSLRRMGPSSGSWDGDRWLHRVPCGDRRNRQVLPTLGDCGAIDRMLATDFATLLPNDLLVKMDIATMAHGLEARSPFLDHELVDAVSVFPEAIKLHGLQTKPLLRDLSRRYVPRAIQTAPKRGFEVPLVRWLRGELRDLTRDVLLARDGLLTVMFDRTALEQLVSQGERLDPARWSRRVWLLLMLGLWDRYVYKVGPGEPCAK